MAQTTDSFPHDARGSVCRMERNGASGEPPSGAEPAMRYTGPPCVVRITSDGSSARDRRERPRDRRARRREAAGRPDVTLRYTLYDANADKNTQTWHDYDVDMKAQVTLWQGMTLATTNWEDQLAAYQTSHDQWVVLFKNSGGT